MGTNNYTITASLTLKTATGDLVTLPTTDLTIYDAELEITSTATNNQVNYDQSTTIKISSTSQQSLTDVFGSITPTYAWSVNNTASTSQTGSTYSTDKLIEATTYALTWKDGSSYTLTSNSLKVTVNSLKNEGVTSTITYNNENSLALSNTSDLSSAYNFAISYQTDSTYNNETIPTSALSGTVSYTIKNSSGDTILSGASSANIAQLAISLSKLVNAGKYTLTANITLTDPNYDNYSITATFSITYNVVSITPSSGNVSNNVLSISENDTGLTLTANTNEVYNSTSFSYQWYTVSSNGTLTKLTGQTNKTYDVPTTGITKTTYEGVVTSDGLTINSTPLTINPVLTTTPTVVISGNQNLYYNPSNSSDGNSDTLTATIMDGNSALTNADYSNLTVTWTVNSGTAQNTNDLTFGNISSSLSSNKS